MASTENVAAYLEGPRAKPLIVKPAPKPSSLKPTQVLLKTHAVAINPIDTLIQQTGMIVPPEAYPFILGNDIAGEVIEVGSSVTKVKAGDRVISCAESGCFQLYHAVDQSLLAILPENVSYVDGSVLPLALCTSAVMLFAKDTLALEYPQIEGKPNGKVVVAWGGASALGSNGIQMLKAAGYDVAAVAGTNTQQYCKDLGADFVFDYKKESVVSEIVDRLKGKAFAGVFCPIMAPDAIASCVEIADKLGESHSSRIVATSMTDTMPYQGKVPDDVKLGYCWGDSLRHNELGPAIWDGWLSKALANGQLRCKPDAEVVGQGLESIQTAMDKAAAGVSAKKLVVVLRDS